MDEETMEDLFNLPRDNPVTKDDLRKIMANKSNVDRLYFLLEEKFPDKQIRSIESFDITIPKDEEPLGVFVKEYNPKDQKMVTGYRDIRRATVTRGMVDNVMFYFEDEWRWADQSTIDEVVTKLEEYFK